MRKWIASAVCALAMFTISASIATAAPPKTYTKQYGFLVTQVFPGSPASTQGIDVGDIIVSVDGVPVRSGADLRDLLAGKSRVEAKVIDVNTGSLGTMLLRPNNGRIGVDGQQTLVGGESPTPPPVVPPYSGTPTPAPVPVPVPPVRPILPGR